jgi:transcriptional regulator with XRE-family HTH domain
VILIKLFRKKNKLTQNQLANLCNVSLKTVCRWETGEREPRASDIKKLCEVLGVSEAELLNGPTKNELKIEFVWEVSDMDILKLESNSFGFGFRGSEVLLWGAMPDEEDEETVAREIAKQIRIARIGKAAMEKARKE